MQDRIGEVHCPVTGRITGSCDQCSMFKSFTAGKSIKCGAKKGQKYKMAARPLSGEFWDTYVLNPQEIKDIAAGRGSIGFATVKAKRAGNEAKLR